MGANAWLAIAVVLVEIMVVIKHGRGMFDAPWHGRALVLGTFSAVTIAWLLRWHARTRLRSAHEARLGSQ